MKPEGDVEFAKTYSEGDFKPNPNLDKTTENLFKGKLDSSPSKKGKMISRSSKIGNTILNKMEDIINNTNSKLSGGKNMIQAPEIDKSTESLFKGKFKFNPK